MLRSSPKTKKLRQLWAKLFVLFELLAESSEAAAAGEGAGAGAEAGETPRQLCRANCRLAMGHDPYKLSGALQNAVQGKRRGGRGERSAPKLKEHLSVFPKCRQRRPQFHPVPSITLTDCHTFLQCVCVCLHECIYVCVCFWHCLKLFAAENRAGQLTWP